MDTAITQYNGEDRNSPNHGADSAIEFSPQKPPRAANSSNAERESTAEAETESICENGVGIATEEDNCIVDAEAEALASESIKYPTDCNDKNNNKITQDCTVSGRRLSEADEQRENGGSVVDNQMAGAASSSVSKYGGFPVVVPNNDTDLRRAGMVDDDDDDEDVEKDERPPTSILAATSSAAAQANGLLEGMDPITGDYIRPQAAQQVSEKPPPSLPRVFELAKGTPPQRCPTAGSLEGMDPETGDYIRRPPLHVAASLYGEYGAAADAARQESFSRQVAEELALDAGQLTVNSTTGKNLRRGWSKRFISTISNRSRQEEDESEDDADNCVFGTQIRFTIMIISTLCLSSILSNILTFNFTFICMAGDRPANASEMSAEELAATGYRADLDYNSVQRSALFMAVAVGALLSVFPLTVMLNKFGSRMVFGVLGYISALSTLLLPASANLGFGWILIIRVIQGVGFSACLPVMGSITSHWSTLKQNGIFIAILSSFLQIAPIFTMPVSGELCTSKLGWPSVYYLHGVICIVLFTVFIFYHRNSPHKHPLMHRKELVKVYFGKGSIYSGPGRVSRKSKKVPYGALYRDPAIWAILVAAVGNFMGTQLSLQFMPTYINKVLFLPIEQTGMASAISPIIMFFIKLLAGQSSDRITAINDQMKLRIYNTLSLGLMGVFFLLLGALDPHSQKSLCLVILILSTCILGFNSGGFFKSSQMVSRQHSHFTLANISFINCVCMLVVPLLNELIAPDNLPDQWKVVLWIHGIILLLTNAFFCVFASSKPASWTLETYTTHDARRNRGGARRDRNSARIAPTDAFR